METLVAFAEALAAPIVGTPNMLNYLPSQARSGAKGKVWTGVFFNWAPVDSGTVTCLEANENSWRFRVEIDKVMPGIHDVGLVITGPDSAVVTYYNTGQQLRMSMRATHDALIFNSVDTSVILEQRRDGREVRFWVKDIPHNLIKTVACHLAF